MRWLSTVSRFDGDRLVLEKMEPRTPRASPSRPASSRSSAPTRWCWRSARTPTSRCSTADPDVTVTDGVVEVSADHVGRRQRRLRRGRRRPLLPHRHRRHRPRPEGGGRHRRLVGTAGSSPSPPPGRRPPSTGSTPGTTPTPPASTAPSSSGPGGRAPSTRSSAASPRRTPSSRPGAASRAATASSATIVSASARTTRCSSSPARPLRDRLRLLQGMRHVRGGVPVRGHRHGARADLTNPRRQGRR